MSQFDTTDVESRCRRHRHLCSIWYAMLGAGVAMIGTSAIAGGTASEALLIIDPTDRDSLYVGNHYKAMRGIPDRNVLYLDSAAANYPTFVDDQIAALLGTLSNRDVSDHIDFIVIAPGAPYRISAPNLITDGCSQVRNFSISGAYSTAFITDDVLGGLPSTTRNHYADAQDLPAAFDSTTSWFLGLPSTDPGAKRYFLGAMLGYTGERGNTVPEILSMIDRSVGADGTFPNGTFYFMETNDQARSGPRHNFYPNAVSEILALGWNAEHRCCSALPSGSHDCLGIMTGVASPAIDSTDMTILPGAICDHLTSYAGYFGTDSQVKMSRWIAQGASGTWGTVEEPCNYAGKFPHAFTHVQYARGLTLGESLFRCAGFVPFQGLLYGDPLTRPFTHIPAVAVPDAPTQPVGGIFTLTPEGTTTKPFAMVESFDVLVDGVWHSTIEAGESISFDSTRYDDGYHDVHVLGKDNTVSESTGTWIGAISIDNHGQSLVIDEVTPTTGDLATAFSFNVSGDANGAAVDAFRLVHNGRVIATAASDLSPMVVHGRMLGGGVSMVQAQMQLMDGSIVHSEPIMLDIADADGTPNGLAPAAFDVTIRVLRGETIVVEMPATDDDVNEELTYTLRSSPTQATVHPGEADHPYRILTVNADASGTDTLTFDVSDGTSTSNAATITLVYEACNYGRLHLDATDLIAGDDADFTLSCGYPNENAWLGYSLKGLGHTPVAGLNVVLDLKQPKQAGSAKMTNADGTATWTLPVPPGVSGRRIFFQSVQRSAVSQWIYRDVQ